jgi:hypothetical protein
MPKAGGAFTFFGQESDGSTEHNLHGMAASSAYVFWAGAKGVYRQPLAGGDSQLWTRTACGVNNLRVLGETVGIYGRPLSGGASTLRVATWPSGPTALTTDGTTLLLGRHGSRDAGHPLYSAPASGRARRPRCTGAAC